MYEEYLKIIKKIDFSKELTKEDLENLEFIIPMVRGSENILFEKINGKNLIDLLFDNCENEIIYQLLCNIMSMISISTVKYLLGNIDKDILKKVFVYLNDNIFLYYFTKSQDGKYHIENFINNKDYIFDIISYYLDKIEYEGKLVSFNLIIRWQEISERINDENLFIKILDKCFQNELLDDSVYKYFFTKQSDNKYPFERLNKYKKELFEELVYEYLYKIDNSNDKMSLAFLEILKDICERSSNREFLGEIIDRCLVSSNFDQSVFDYYFTKQSDNKYPLENLTIYGTEIIRDFTFSYIDLLQTNNRFNYQSINKIKEICEKINNNKLFEDVMEYYLKNLDMTEPDVLVEESNYFLREEEPKSVVDYEFNELINTLKKEMTYNESYNNIIDYFINSFYISYNNNSKLTKFTLQVIIKNLKNGNLDKNLLYEYYYYYGKTIKRPTSIYDIEGKCIVLDGINISPSTSIHENGHLIHDMLDYSNVPDDFNEFINSLSYKINSKEIDKFKELFSKLGEKVKNEMIQRLEQDDFFKKLYDNLNFSDILSTLYIDFDLKEFIENYSTEQIKKVFIEEQRNIIIDQMINLYLRINEPFLVILSDILDAIYEGKMHEEMFPGHGKEYYFGNDDNRFSEIFANYYTICMICPEKINELRNILGQDFIDYMDSYLRKISDSFKETKKEHR